MEATAGETFGTTIINVAEQMKGWLAVINAVMRAHGLTNLASNDADFDRVPGLTRHAPV